MKLGMLYIIIFSFLVLNTAAQSPEPLNQTDPKGMKQGHWIKKSQTGHVIYDGYFRDNIPEGTFKRYYDNDTLQAVLVYSEGGKVADAVLYHRNGFIASRGGYVNQLKEGKWKFYSAVTRDYLLSEEEYLHNMKNGLSIRYYTSKVVSERLNYLKDLKSGEWNQYFPDGQVCLTGNYAEGELNGKFTIYYENGQIEFSGQYKNDARDGEWIKYNRDGSVKTRINYISGVATNPAYYKQESEYLDALEKNKGKIADPEKTGTIWQ